ncbi:MAG: glycoside hydrolase family 13 protein, partial [Clostridia bacterium]|nr:glycoside hydrolase family 13 protein [Clostridia bacterium]
VNIIYLNPIAEAHSNHRYNTADYKKVDPLLGTNEDFRSLCDEAHKTGLKIVIDGVFSHTGDDSVYFNKYGRYASLGAYQSDASPYASWYTFGKTRDDYDSWWGIKTLPEVNENDPGYSEFITGKNGVIDFWMELGADGIRLDVADELPDAFIEKVRTAVKRHGENKLLLGEVWEDASNKISHGGRRTYFNGRQLDCVMNYPFRTAIIDFLLDSNAEKFMYRVCSIVNNYPPEVMDACMNVLGTHDTERILTALTGIDLENKSRASQARMTFTGPKITKAKKLLENAVIINYFLPGIPSIYYGDETGMTGGKDPFNRAFFKENNDPLLTSFYIQLGQLRRSLPVLKDGGFFPLSAERSCAAFLRYKPGEKRAAVIVNMNPEAITYDLNYDMRTMTVRFGGEKLNGAVMIEANSAAIITD